MGAATQGAPRAPHPVLPPSSLPREVQEDQLGLLGMRAPQTRRQAQGAGSSEAGAGQPWAVRALAQPLPSQRQIPLLQLI